MSVHAYPTDAVAADYARAGLGLALVGVPLLALDTLPWVMAALAVGSAVFAAAAARAVAEHLTRIGVDGDGVQQLRPWPRRIAWRDVRGVRLTYYSTWRDRSKGWLHLRITGAHARLSVDSRITGFDALTQRAAAAATANGVTLDAATAANLEAMGVAAAPVTMPDGAAA